MSTATIGGMWDFPADILRDRVRFVRIVETQTPRGAPIRTATPLATLNASVQTMSAQQKMMAQVPLEVDRTNVLVNESDVIAAGLDIRQDDRIEVLNKDTDAVMERHRVLAVNKRGGIGSLLGIATERVT